MLEIPIYQTLAVLGGSMSTFDGPEVRLCPLDTCTTPHYLDLSLQLWIYATNVFAQRLDEPLGVPFHALL